MTLPFLPYIPVLKCKIQRKIVIPQKPEEGIYIGVSEKY